MDNTYTLDMSGAEEMDSDVKSGHLSREARARMLLRAARDHGATATRLGDVVTTVDEGERRDHRTAVSLMAWLGY